MQKEVSIMRNATTKEELIGAYARLDALLRIYVYHYPEECKRIVSACKSAIERWKTNRGRI